MNVSKQPVNSATVKEDEIVNMRQNLLLLRSQAQIGRMESSYLDKQLEKVLDLLTRMHSEHRVNRHQSRLEGLYVVTSQLGSSLDPQEVFDQVMDSIIKLTNAERGFLMLRGDDGQLEIRAARHFDQQQLSNDRFNFSRTVLYEAIDTGVPINTFNATEDPRFAGQASVIGGSLRSIMAVPLKVRDDVIGAIYVDNSAKVGVFSDADSEALVSYANHAAIAIANARAYSATDQQLNVKVSQLTQLAAIDIRLSETLEMERIIGLTLDYSCRIAGADRGHYGIFQAGHIMTAQNHPPGTDDTQPFLLDKLYPQLLDVAAAGEPAILADSMRNEHVMFVPIRRRDRTVSGIVVLRRAASTFNDEQQWLVNSIVSRAAIALENAQLYAAVQAADRAKTEFVGVVAHDLKVPMSSILGYADLMLMDGGLQEEQEHFLNRIKGTVKRMEILVSDLADISRIENGLFYMDESEVTIDEIVQGVRDNIIPEIKQRKHAYIEQVEPGLPLLYVDYYRLLQVLTNLLSNAYKYTPNGGAITFRAQRRGARVEFSVIDTGIGLSAEAKAKLGTKFWRAADEFTRSQPGTGLGYAITAKLVEQMGSRIEIESEVGKGSAFTFTIATVTS